MTTPNRYHYRAWDKKAKVMLDGINLYNDNWIMLVDYMTPTDDEDELYPHWDTCGEEHNGTDRKNVEVMQSTGLKDKNGVDIYEGDVIKLQATKGLSVLICPVEWDDDGAEFDMKHPKGYHGHYGLNWKIIDTCDVFQVIGNIHEHPHLLTDEGSAS